MSEDMRINPRLTERFPLACRCGQPLAWTDMRRLVPPRASAAGSVAVQRIGCRDCAEQVAQ